MKEFRITILLLIITPLLCACFSGEPEIKNPVNFYYLRSEIDYGTDHGVIAAQVWDAAEHYGDMRYMLEAYLRAPIPEDMVSPFPDGLALVAVWSVGDCLYVKLNETISELGGLDLTLACSCIARTCFDMVHIEQVRISANSGLLDGADYITIRSDSLLLNEIEMTAPEVKQ